MYVKLSNISIVHKTPYTFAPIYMNSNCVLKAFHFCAQAILKEVFENPPVLETFTLQNNFRGQDNSRPQTTIA